MEKLLSWFSDASSVIGLFVTLFILLRIKSIEKKYLFRVRGPELIRDLRDSASNISRYLSDFSDSLNEVGEELAVCQATLRNLTSKLEGDRKRTSKRLYKKIKKQRKNLTSYSMTEIRDIYYELNYLVTELTHIRKDVEWSNRHGI